MGKRTYLLKQLDLKKDDFFSRNRVKVLFKGKDVDIPDNLDELIDRLSQMFPDERENVRKFFEEAKKAYEEIYKDTDDFGVPLPEYLIVKVFGSKKLLNYPKEHPNLYRWLNKTFKEILDELFKNEELKGFLVIYSGYTGTKPEKTSALTALTAWIGYLIYGGYLPKAQKFVNALKDFIEKNGGKVVIN